MMILQQQDDLVKLTHHLADETVNPSPSLPLPLPPTFRPAL